MTLLKMMLLTITALAQGGGFRFDGPLGRVITPNGDNRNDVAIFCFGNPSDSDVEGRIYSLRGAEVARLSRAATVAGCAGGGLNLQSMTWDPRGGVTSGVYVYQVRSEALTFTGTLLVVR